jgi:hypothetical protein
VSSYNSVYLTKLYVYVLILLYIYISYCSTYVIAGALRDLLHVEEVAEQECLENEGAHGAQSDRSLEPATVLAEGLIH